MTPLLPLPGREKFDWAAMAAKLNAYPQFKLPVTTERGPIDLHYIHALSPHAGAKPLLLTHGWPGSVFEFHKIIPMLTEPGNIHKSSTVACT